MSYSKKVIELFKNFPTDSSYVKELYEGLLSERKVGTNIILVRGRISFVELQIFNFASIRKVYPNELIREFYISFYDYSLEKEIISESFSKEEINIIFDYIFPFILTRGKDRIHIPLLLKDFPSFARYALEYNTPVID